MSNNRNAIFYPNMKMADIILSNYMLLTILSRFGIDLGFGEKTVKQVCGESNVDETFFILICNVYSFREYMPCNEELMRINICSLINYLQSSHRYYLDNKILSIEQKLQELEQSSACSHKKVIKEFFAEYKNEIINHFQYEEKTVFPYIEALITDKNCVSDFNINQYEENHSNIEDKLSDLKNIVIKYLPKDYSSDLKTSVLFEIFLFEDDLTKHSLIEEKILIPIVSEIERSYE